MRHGGQLPITRSLCFLCLILGLITYPSSRAEENKSPPKLCSPLTRVPSRPFSREELSVPSRCGSQQPEGHPAPESSTQSSPLSFVHWEEGAAVHLHPHWPPSYRKTSTDPKSASGPACLSTPLSRTQGPLRKDEKVRVALGGWGEAAGPTSQERLEAGWGSGRLGLPGLGRDGMAPGHWLEGPFPGTWTPHHGPCGVPLGKSSQVWDQGGLPLRSQPPAPPPPQGGKDYSLADSCRGGAEGG